MVAARLPAAIRSIPVSARFGLNSAVHIKIHPRPRNLAESREVLRVLQQYGEIAVYKHLKYEPHAPAPNTALAIFRSTSAAQSLLDASPLRFELKEGKSEWTLIDSDLSAFDQAEKNRQKEEWIAFEEEQQRRYEKAAQEQEDVDIVNDDISSAASIDSHSSKATRGETSFPVKDGSTRWGATFGSEKSTPNAPAPSPSPSPSPPKARPPPTFTPNPLPPTPMNPFAEAPFPPPEALPLPSTSPQRRELHLSISRSFTNHDAYIKRQGYYGDFKLNRKTIMAEDLENRVPLEGMLDVSLSKEEVPLRIRIRKQEKQVQKSISLREMWEQGRRERSESTVQHSDNHIGKAKEEM